jgi:hypothetical protein
VPKDALTFLNISSATFFCLSDLPAHLSGCHLAAMVRYPLVTCEQPPALGHLHESDRPADPMEEWSTRYSTVAYHKPPGSRPSGASGVRPLTRGITGGGAMGTVINSDAKRRETTEGPRSNMHGVKTAARHLLGCGGGGDA